MNICTAETAESTKVQRTHYWERCRRVAGLKTALDSKSTDYENEGGRDSDLIRFHKHFIGNVMKGDDKVKGESARERNLFSQRE